MVNFVSYESDVSMFGTEYDFASITHYPSNAFTKNGSATIVAKEPGSNNVMVKEFCSTKVFCKLIFLCGYRDKGRSWAKATSLASIGCTIVHETYECGNKFLMKLCMKLFLTLFVIKNIFENIMRCKIKAIVVGWHQSTFCIFITFLLNNNYIANGGITKSNELVGTIAIIQSVDTNDVAFAQMRSLSLWKTHENFNLKINLRSPSCVRYQVSWKQWYPSRFSRMIWANNE